MEIGWQDCCDAGCTRPVPVDDPWALMRLGWTIEGPLPTCQVHEPHTAAQPYLTHRYVLWLKHPEARYICASCSDAR